MFERIFSVSCFYVYVCEHHGCMCLGFSLTGLKHMK